MIDYAHWYARMRPEAEALVLGETRITYAGLADAADALARALIAAGVAPGDRVATLQTPCPDFFVAYLATTSIGAIWCGLNPRYTARELAYVIEDAQPRVLLARARVAERDFSEELQALAQTPGLERILFYEDGAAGADLVAFLKEGASVSESTLAERRARAGGREGCLLVYTSGTTGAPKGALLHQQGIIDFAHEQNALWPASPMSMLNFLPINHVGCTVDMATPVLVAGGTTYFMEKFDAAASLDIMEREGIPTWGGMPTIFSLQLAELERKPRDLSAVQLIVFEGAPISRDVLERLAAICPMLATNYGQTESTSAIAATPPTSDFDLLLNSVGEAFSGVEVRLADADGREPPEGEAGEILARSRYLFLGYWNKPEATAAAMTEDGFLRTGDLGVRRPDGRYRIVGRLKEMFKSGGYNIYPREVENVLEEHPCVIQAVLTPRPDPLWQEVGVAYVTVSAAVTSDEILRFARTRLANYKIPKALFIESAFPLLPNGKIDRTLLRERAKTIKLE